MTGRDVFISYHTDSCKDVVEKISILLEEYGITCWYAPRDVMGVYTEDIEKAINKCRVFLLILNEKANNSMHVKSELGLAFTRANENEDIAILPFRIDDCNIRKGKLNYNLNQIHIMDGTKSSEEYALSELVDRIANMLGVVYHWELIIRNSEGERKYYITKSQIAANETLIGRTAEIAETVQMLERHGGRAVLHGVGGMGKSIIAKEVARRCADTYNIVLWVDFRDSILKTVINDYTFPVEGMSRDDYPADDDITYYNRKMQIFKVMASDKMLVVLDNFDVCDDDLLDDFCKGEQHVLITSRCLQKKSGFRVIDVCSMRIEEQIQLFLCMYQKEIEITEERISVLRQIFEFLGSNTLFICLIGTFMKNQGMTPEDMLSVIINSNFSVNQLFSSGETGHSDYYLRPLFNANELCILKNLSLIPLSGIDVNDFCKWCEFDSFTDIDRLIYTGIIIHDPITNKIHLHSSISEIMKKELENDCSCCESLVQAMVKAIEGIFEISIKKKQEIYGYISFCCSQLPEDSSLLTSAQMGLALILNLLSRHDESIAVYKDMLQKELSSEQRVLACARLAKAYAQAELYEECWNTIQIGLQLIADTPNEDLPLKMFRAKNWLLQRGCDCARRLDRIEEAKWYGEQAVHMISTNKKNLMQREWVHDIGWSKYHYAYSLLLIGKPQESIAQLNEAIDLFDKTDQPYSRAFCIGLLGQAEMCMGNIQEALDLTDECAEYMATRAEAQNDKKAYLSCYYGNIYRTAGDENKALIYYEKSLHSYSKCSPRKAQKVQTFLNQKSNNVLINI